MNRIRPLAYPLWSHPGAREALNLSPSSPTGRAVSLLMAIVVSFCGCTLRALAMDGEASIDSVSVPLSCCHQHACDSDEDDPAEAPDSGACHCIHGATALDAGHESTLSLLAHPPITMTVGCLPDPSQVDADEPDPMLAADPPPDDGSPARCPRTLRRIVVLQV